MIRPCYGVPLVTLIVTMRGVEAGDLTKGRSGIVEVPDGYGASPTRIAVTWRIPGTGVEHGTDAPRADVHAEGRSRGISDDRGLHPVRPIERPSGGVDEEVRQIDPNKFFNGPRKFDRVGDSHRVGRGPRDAAMRLDARWFGRKGIVFANFDPSTEDHDPKALPGIPSTDGVKAVFSNRGSLSAKAVPASTLRTARRMASAVALPCPVARWLGGRNAALVSLSAPTVAETRLFDPSSPTVGSGWCGADGPEHPKALVSTASARMSTEPVPGPRYAHEAVPSGIAGIARRGRPREPPEIPARGSGRRCPSLVTR